MLITILFLTVVYIYIKIPWHRNLVILWTSQSQSKPSIDLSFLLSTSLFFVIQLIWLGLCYGKTKVTLSLLKHLFSVPDRSDMLYFFMWKFLLHISKPESLLYVSSGTFVLTTTGLDCLFLSFFCFSIQRWCFWNQCLPNASWSDAALYEIQIIRRRIYSYFIVLLFTLLFILSSQGNDICFSVLVFYLFLMARIIILISRNCIILGVNSLPLF